MLLKVVLTWFVNELGYWLANRLFFPVLYVISYWSVVLNQWAESKILTFKGKQTKVGYKAIFHSVLFYLVLVSYKFLYSICCITNLQTLTFQTWATCGPIPSWKNCKYCAQKCMSQIISLLIETDCKQSLFWLFIPRSYELTISLDW